MADETDKAPLGDKITITVVRRLGDGREVSGVASWDADRVVSDVDIAATITALLRDVRHQAASLPALPGGQPG